MCAILRSKLSVQRPRFQARLSVLRATSEYDHRVMLTGVSVQVSASRKGILAEVRVPACDKGTVFAFGQERPNILVKQWMVKGRTYLIHWNKHEPPQVST